MRASEKKRLKKACTKAVTTPDLIVSEYCGVLAIYPTGRLAEFQDLCPVVSVGFPASMKPWCFSDQLGMNLEPYLLGVTLVETADAFGYLAWFVAEALNVPITTAFTGRPTLVAGGLELNNNHVPDWKTLAILRGKELGVFDAEFPVPQDGGEEFFQSWASDEMIMVEDPFSPFKQPKLRLGDLKTHYSEQGLDADESLDGYRRALKRQVVA